MNWKEIAESRDFEEPSIWLMQISEDFLQMYFDYEKDEAKTLLTKFLQKYPNEWADGWSVEDLIHHEMPYYFAAIVHFHIGKNGDREGFLKWFEKPENKKGPNWFLYGKEKYGFFEN